MINALTWHPSDEKPKGEERWYITLSKREKGGDTKEERMPITERREFIQRTQAAQ